MQQYILRRFIVAVPTVIGITIVTFLLMYVLPGDPVEVMMGERLDQQTMEMLRQQLGLDDPLPVRYLRFLGNAIRGDFGTSYQTRQPVRDMIAAAFPATLKLTALAYLISLIMGVFLGIHAAVHHNSWSDLGTMVFALIGMCAPSFMVALVLLYVFALRIPWFPLGGYGSFRYMILPAITLGIRPAAMLARITRSGMLEVLRQEYVRTARAKGLHERTVLMKHALKNCLIPVITVMGEQISSLLGGSVLIEAIFAWPGMGKLSVEGINALDFPVVQGAVLVSAVVVVSLNLLVDLSYSLVNPRIRYE
ncbi:MAG: ABC transporter permease [Bacillota bacterium]